MQHLSRRHLMTWIAAPAWLSAAGCSTAPARPEEVAGALAPSGRLRAAINLGNPILARRQADTAAATGVSVDLAQALASQLGLAAELLVVDAAAQAVALVSSGQADIGFFAIDPQRAGGGISFTAPYVQIEGAYLVRQDSPLTDNAQVDSPGQRIMVGQGSAYDLTLSRQLQHATLLRTPTSPTVVERFLAEGAEVAAGVRQQMEADAARLGGLRLLPGRFMVINQAMGVQAGRGAAAEAALRGFVEQAKSSGFVARSLARHGIQGASVAPAA